MTPEEFKNNVQERVRRRSQREEKREQAMDSLEEALSTVLPAETCNWHTIRFKRTTPENIQLIHEFGPGVPDCTICTISAHLNGGRFSISVDGMKHIPTRAWKYLKGADNHKINEDEMYRRLTKFLGQAL